MAILEAKQLTLGYNGQRVVWDLHLLACPGSVLALAGPNGAGKTTLLRGMARLLRPEKGAVLLDGRDIRGFSSREMARRVGLVSQGEPLDWPMTVEQVVALGRAARRGWFLPLSRSDQAALDWALAQTGLLPLRDRSVTALSGGEQQRVLIARALAQEPNALLLDEPTAHLDLRFQGTVLGLVRRLAHECGLTAVISMHDLNLAALYADRVALIADGKLLAEGTPWYVFTVNLLERAYGVPISVTEHPIYGTPMVTPVIGSAENERAQLDRRRSPDPTDLEQAAKG